MRGKSFRISEAAIQGYGDRVSFKGSALCFKEYETMVEFPQKKIYIYSREVDFRKGLSSLSSLIELNFPEEELDASLFLFFSRNARQIKIIEIEKDGIWLYQKRLNDSRFVFAKTDNTIRIDKEKLKLILSSSQKLKHRSKR